MNATYQCGYCGEPVDTWVDPDPALGARYELIEDCAVCCRPNVLTIEVDRVGRTARITARYEG